MNVKVKNTIRIDKDLEEEFTSLAYKLGKNPTSLLNVIVRSFVSKEEFSSELDYVEIELFSEKEMKDLLGDKKNKESIDRFESVAFKLKKELVLS